MVDGSMAMSFRSLSYTSPQVLSDISKSRNLRRTRSNPYLAVPPLVFLRTDERDNLPKNKSYGSSGGSVRSDTPFLLRQANSVGIIGGVSVNSTLKFLRKLVQWSSEYGEDSPPFVLCSDPQLNKDLLSYERSSHPSLSGKSESYRLHQTLSIQNLQSKRIFLENSGAKCIVMPCHISHSWHDEVYKGCSVPFLHIGECVARELKEARLKPLEAGSPLRIGVLATNATLSAGFYQEKLENEGFEVVLPDKATMEHTVIPAVEALNRNDLEGAKNLLRIALQVLLVRAVNTIILASDDMRELLPRDDPLLKKCVDPIDALARSTINWVKSVEKCA